MCGITGYFGKGDRDILEKMTNSIRYRGPDDEGFFIDGDVGLGHRRLSIIDLSPAGHQPMFNEDKSIAIVFNGEIYNFKEYQKELERKGHKFAGVSDTEVIIHLYEEYGENVFSKLNGMFAIAIYDGNKNKLLLARDRFGQKSLYYSLKNSTLVFGSEIKSLLQHPDIDKILDERSLFQFFSFDYVPQPKTVFKGIKKLENGQLLVFNGGKINLSNYYKIEITPNFFGNKVNEKEAIEKFENLFEDSVKLRLVSDVPLGVFLSGGIDSSSIAYWAAKNKNDLKTFSIGFKEKSFDEGKYAEKVARILGSNHRHQEFTSENLIQCIPEVFSKLDEPFGDPSILPTFLLSKFTRREATVALSGDGGDEFLMGYPNYKVHKILNFAKLNNLKLNKKMIDGLLKILPFSDDNLASSFRVQRMALSAQFKSLYRDFIIIGAYNNQFDKLFNFSAGSRNLFDFADSFLSGYKHNNHREKMAVLFQKYYLSDDILFKADRASMYNSLEVRAPFLDYRLAGFLNNLPLELKLKGFKSKYILKKSMVGKLPDEIINRKKKGFGIPLTRWFRGELKDYLLDVLSSNNFKKIDFINQKTVEILIKQHLSGKVDNRKILWNLVVFQNWHQNYLS